MQYSEYENEVDKAYHVAITKIDFKRLGALSQINAASELSIFDNKDWEVFKLNNDEMCMQPE